MNHFRTHYTYLTSLSLHTPLSAGSDAAVVVVHMVLLNRKEIKIAMISLKKIVVVKGGLLSVRTNTIPCCAPVPLAAYLAWLTYLSLEGRAYSVHISGGRATESIPMFNPDGTKREQPDDVH